MLGAQPDHPGPHRGPPQRPDGKPGEGKPETKGSDGKKPEEGKGKESAGDEKKGEQPGPKPITRPESPEASPRPEELRIKPDKDGKIQFQFHGQKWPAVLTWLADWSEMSLDWQQLPGDFVNLTTSRKYTAREARDLINEHLLARGYTMLDPGRRAMGQPDHQARPRAGAAGDSGGVGRPGSTRIRQGLFPARLARRRNGGQGTRANEEPQRQTEPADSDESA